MSLGTRPGSGVFSSLRSPQFRILWIGMLFSSGAMQINLVSRPWLAYELTGSGLDLGAVAAARALPQLLLAPIGGVLADRFNKRRVLVASQSGLAVLALVNAILVHANVVEIWHLIALGAAQGVVFPFTMPTRQALIPSLVARDQMANALAIDSSGRNVNRVVAPAIAGLLLAWSPAIAFYAIAVFYLGALITVLRLPSGSSSSSKPPWSLAEMGAGFVYIRRRPLLLSLVVTGFAVVGLGMPFQHLLPAFQVEVLDVGPRALGLMYTAVGIGGLASSLVIAYLAKDVGKGWIQVLAGVVFGVALASFALSTNYALSVVLLAVVGFASQGYLTLNRVTVLSHTEPALYGRVLSIYSMTWALSPMAVLPMGALIDVVGPRATLSVAGFALAAIVVMIAMINPALWKQK